METKRNSNRTRKSARALGLVGILSSAFALLAMSAAPAAAAAANLAEAEAIPIVARLTVQALDGDKGGALKGADILIYDGFGMPMEKGLTDDNGLFDAYLAEGPHKVWVGAEGYTQSENVVEMALGFETELVVKLYSMRVPPGAGGNQDPANEEPVSIDERHLLVYVMDAASGASAANAIANATVLVKDNTETVMAKGLTDAEGRFETMLPPGEYKVWIFADGYIEHAQAVQIDASSRAAVVKAALIRNADTSPSRAATH